MRSRSHRKTDIPWKSTEDSPFYYLQTESYYTVKVEDPDLTQILLDNGVEVKGKKPSANSTLLDILLVYVLPIALVLGIPDVYYEALRRGRRYGCRKEQRQAV